MPVLLGGRSVWMKGSTGVHSGEACQGRGGKGEKGGVGRLMAREGEKRMVRQLGAAWRRRAWVGDGRQGARSVKAVAGRAPAT
jgi:hypothetical protein